MSTNIHFLGTCAGTEPYPGRHHTSFVVECQGHLYWFDAGECCSYTAHLMGLDLLNVDKVIISHTHLDHIGGLMNLIGVMEKLKFRRKQEYLYGDVELYIPNVDTWNCIEKTMDSGAYLEKKPDHKVRAVQIVDGVLFDDGILKVTAYHNRHLRFHSFAPWQSFSFLIELDGKRLVYSGDVASYQELDMVIGNGCDGLIIETGHHSIATAYEYCKNKKIGKVYFSHHGREILDDEEGAVQKVSKLFGEKAVICKDGMSVWL